MMTTAPHLMAAVPTGSPPWRGGSLGASMRSPPGNLDTGPVGCQFSRDGRGSMQEPGRLSAAGTARRFTIIVDLGVQNPPPARGPWARHMRRGFRPIPVAVGRAAVIRAGLSVPQVLEKAAGGLHGGHLPALDGVD